MQRETLYRTPQWPWRGASGRPYTKLQVLSLAQLVGELGVWVGPMGYCLCIDPRLDHLFSGTRCQGRELSWNNRARAALQLKPGWVGLCMSLYRGSTDSFCYNFGKYHTTLLTNDQSCHLGFSHNMDGPSSEPTSTQCVVVEWKDSDGREWYLPSSTLSRHGKADFQFHLDTASNFFYKLHFPMHTRRATQIMSLLIPSERVTSLELGPLSHDDRKQLPRETKVQLGLDVTRMRFKLQSHADLVVQGDTAIQTSTSYRSVMSLAQMTAFTLYLSDFGSQVKENLQRICDTMTQSFVPSVQKHAVPMQSSHSNSGNNEVKYFAFPTSSSLASGIRPVPLQYGSEQTPRSLLYMRRSSPQATLATTYGSVRNLHRLLIQRTNTSPQPSVAILRTSVDDPAQLPTQRTRTQRNIDS